MQAYNTALPEKVSIPDRVPDEQKKIILDVLERISELRIEDRRYALDEADLPDDEVVRRDFHDNPYVVDGKKPLANDAAVATEPYNENYIRIAVQWNSRAGHFLEDGVDHAGNVYKVMEQEGISRPEGDPTAGVQIRTNNIAIENRFSINNGDN